MLRFLEDEIGFVLISCFCVNSFLCLIPTISEYLQSKIHVVKIVPFKLLASFSTKHTANQYWVHHVIIRGAEKGGGKRFALPRE